MIYVYYFIIFITSIASADLQVISLFNIGSINVYAIDIIFLFFIITAIYVIIKTPFSFFTSGGKLFSLFLCWLLVEMIAGYMIYGYRSIGEARYVFWLLAFFIPVVFVPKSHLMDADVLIKITRNTVYISAASVIALFVIEYLYGGRFFIAAVNMSLLKFEDWRGIRYLGSEETYTLCILICYIFFKKIENSGSRKEKIIDYGMLIGSLLIVVFVQNRAAPLSVFTIFCTLLLLQGRRKTLFLFLAAIFMIVGGLSVISPETGYNIVESFSSVLDMESDTTGNWRSMVQLSAFYQALEKPVFGQGFGGYFFFHIPEWGVTFDTPPHNIFIYLFLKTGIIGAIMCLLPILAFAMKYLAVKHIIRDMDSGVLLGSKAAENVGNDKNEYMNNSRQYRIFADLFIVIVISQLLYGNAYGFSNYYAIFFMLGTLLFHSLTANTGNTLTK